MNQMDQMTTTDKEDDIEVGDGALKAPMPYFGGKSKIAQDVWARFGAVQNYVEPFFGSGAMLLGRPDPTGIETVNDKDGMVANFWRALQRDPQAVAAYADWPVNENDLHARHIWLVGQKHSLQARLEGDPEWCDAQIAGWWVWGMSCWIGGGFCSGEGPWSVRDRQLVHLGNAGQGVNRKLVHLGAGRGVNRKLVHLGDAGQGDDLVAWMQRLARRLRHVRVCCGDWSRICGPTPTVGQGLTAVFLDPPYAESAGRDMAIYSHDSGSVAHEVREWAIAHGQDPRMRIALCGYAGEHAMPETWTAWRWAAQGGYGGQGDGRGRENRDRETVWFSPHCLTQTLPLFAGLEEV